MSSEKGCPQIASGEFVRSECNRFRMGMSTIGRVKSSSLFITFFRLQLFQVRQARRKACLSVLPGVFRILMLLGTQEGCQSRLFCYWSCGFKQEADRDRALIAQFSIGHGEI